MGNSFLLGALITNLEWSKILCWKEVLLSNSIKKDPASSQGHQSGEQLIERPWLQLMCCALVSSYEVVVYFGVIEVVKTKALKGRVQESEWTR